MTMKSSISIINPCQSLYQKTTMDKKRPNNVFNIKEDDRLIVVLYWKKKINDYSIWKLIFLMKCHCINKVDGLSVTYFMTQGIYGFFA